MAVTVVACEEPSTAAGPFHTTKAEDLTAAGPTRPSRVGTWPDQGRRVAEKPHDQDENSVTSDFEARVAPRPCSLPPLRALGFLALTLTLRRSQSVSLQFILTPKAHLSNLLQRASNSGDEDRPGCEYHLSPG